MANAFPDQWLVCCFFTALLQPFQNIGFVGNRTVMFVSAQCFCGFLFVLHISVQRQVKQLIISLQAFRKIVVALHLVLLVGGVNLVFYDDGFACAVGYEQVQPSACVLCRGADVFFPFDFGRARVQAYLRVDLFEEEPQEGVARMVQAFWVEQVGKESGMDTCFVGRHVYDSEEVVVLSSGVFHFFVSSG